MLTTLAVLLLAAQPHAQSFPPADWPAESTPTTLHAAYDTDPAQDAISRLDVPAELTGYAIIRDYGNQRSEVRFGPVAYGSYHTPPRWTDRYSGFMRFEMAAIPESVKITSVELDYYQYQVLWDGPTTVSIRAFEYPSQSRGDTIVSRIGRGIVLSSNRWSYDGWNRFPLHPSTITIIDSCRHHGHHLSLGIPSHSGNRGGATYGTDGPDSLRPYLRIRYLVPSPDVGVIILGEPADTVESRVPVIPRALVQNFSIEKLTFPVRFSIGADYVAETTMTLEPGAEDMARFAPWTPRDTGRYEVKCSTMLANDENRANDRITGSVVVVPSGSISETPTPSDMDRFALYPNPARGRLWLESSVSAALYGPDGRRVAILHPGENNLHRLGPGVYFAQRPGGGRFARLVLVR